MYRAPSEIICNYRYDPRMAGDGRAADRTLIAGRRHDNDPATQSKVECFLKTAPSSRR